jgi:HD-GYP domain-containing protein (c-di-GMP phosphodiesterase class II)
MPATGEVVTRKESPMSDQSGTNLEALTQAFDMTLASGASALDMRDREGDGHAQRVADETVRLARSMGVPEEQLVHIRRGALLHDVGKTIIPDKILLKPGSLTESEWEVVRRHPLFGYKLLEAIEYLKPALDIPYCHHERWDGSGYPRGLKGEEIPLAARIFAIVDVREALLTRRPYRNPWQRDVVDSFIQSLSGTHFDPEVVKAFASLVEEPPEGVS